MEVVKEVCAHGAEVVARGMEALRTASLGVQCAVGVAGFLVSAYGVYYVWFFRGTRRVKSKVSLAGKTVVITGANSGIGRETAVDLARRGARIIMACRNPDKAQAALVEVRRRSGNDNVVFRPLDVSDLKSVRAFAEQYLKEEDRLDILINNAGIGGQKHQLSAEGFDTVMATNHIGPFLLTMLLIDLLKKSSPGRIINVSSLAHSFLKEVDFTNKGGVRGFDQYSRSKLANILFAKELARRLEGTGVTAYSLHPGVIYSSIWNSSYTSLGQRTKYLMAVLFFWLFMLNERDGAQTTIYCAVDESITHLSGRYFANCRLAKESALAKDDALAKQLWDVSCEATAIDPNILPAN